MCGGRVRRRRDRGVAAGTGAVRCPVRSSRDGAPPVSRSPLGTRRSGGHGGRHLPHRVRATCHVRPVATGWRGHGSTASPPTWSRSTGAARRGGFAPSRGSRHNDCHRPTSPTGSTVEVDAADAWPRVVDAVAALPEPERDALMLHVWEGLGYEDVADALGVPIGTVRSRLHRARQRLRELAAASARGHVDNVTGRRPGRIQS